MDYHQKLPILDRMCEEYANSSVVMYGQVGNWIPIYKMYVAFAHMRMPKNSCKFFLKFIQLNFVKANFIKTK